MNIFLMVIMLTFLALLFGFLSKLVDAKKQQSFLKVNELEQEVIRLQARVNHLEAIVTDKAYQLKKEIDNLKL